MSERVGVSHVAVVTADLDRFRAFYEDTIGLATTVVFGAGQGHAGQAVIAAGNVMLHVFEVPGFDPAPHGFGPAMFERGRLDHIGFSRRRRGGPGCAARPPARSGRVEREHPPPRPMLSVRFHDPDGLEGEINCLDPSYDPTTLRDEDEIVDPAWLECIRSVMRRDA